MSPYHDGHALAAVDDAGDLQNNVNDNERALYDDLD